MNFIKLLYSRIFQFFNRFWPNNFPETYAYLFLSFVFTLNLIALLELYYLIFNPYARLNPLLGLLFFVIPLLFNYYLLISNDRYKIMIENKFHKRLSSTTQSIVTLVYILLSIFLCILFAYYKRQYMLN